MIQARLLFGTTLLFLSMQQSALASFTDGNELYDQCSKPSLVFCQAFIMGDVEVMKDKGMMICLPQNTVTKQLMDVVTTAIRDDPANRTIPAHYLVINAPNQGLALPAEIGGGAGDAPLTIHFDRRFVSLGLTLDPLRDLTTHPH